MVIEYISAQKVDYLRGGEIMEKLVNSSNKIVGAKQTKKAIETGRASVVYIAKDADAMVTEPIINLCKAKGIEIIYIETMKELGKVCAIDVGAATAALPVN